MTIILCDERFVGDPNDPEFLVIKNSLRFNGCCFENVFIDDSDVVEDIFTDCYFENVKFASGKHLTGVGGGNHQYPAPSLAKEDIYLAIMDRLGVKLGPAVEHDHNDRSWAEELFPNNLKQMLDSYKLLYIIGHRS